MYMRYKLSLCYEGRARMPIPQDLSHKSYPTTLIPQELSHNTYPTRVIPQNLFKVFFVPLLKVVVLRDKKLFQV
ncbi:hypothetical protein CAL7102_05690 [Dulcicalothrix desertica PCC 7102]|nr:hypothetical protein CAL7102_05690 [Dulcicalothrix desertica PCC 7102]